MRSRYLLLFVAASMSGCGGSGTGPVVAPASPTSNPVAANHEIEPSLGAAVSSARSADPLILPELILRLSDPGIVRPASALPDSQIWEIADGTALVQDKDGLFQPISTGKVQLKSTNIEGRHIIQPIVVEESQSLDFAADILPILTRHGCNSGGCHGRLDGQNGFKLSLFGYASAEDYRSITRDSGGRRIDLLDPDSSLILSKSTGRVPHGGGQALPPGSADASRLRRWVVAGVPESASVRYAIKSLMISSDSISTDKSGEFVLQTIAEYDDGTSRDVSAWSAWKSLDDRVATVDNFGRVSILDKGETHIVVRHGSHVRTARVSFTGNPLEVEDFASLDSDSFIDKAISDHLKRLNVPPSPLADDATYLRRVTLDIVGRLPEPVEIRRFLKETAPDKREKAVDSLLKDNDFTKFWSLKFGDLLSISSVRQGNATPFYLLWLQEQIEQGTPWDKLVEELLTKRGTPASRLEAAASYSLENTDPVVAGQLAAQRFLGVRLRCAQCHDHPFDVWTQTQAHEFAAFFAKVRPTAPMPGEAMPRARIEFAPEGQVIHPLTKVPVDPHVLTGDQPIITPESDPLPTLATWMTSPENPFFAKAMVNFLWAQFFATGLVDPVDDLSASNPPSHSELLEALAARFRELNYDTKAMVREIVTSRAYGLSSRSDDRNRLFARFNAYQAPRALSAQQAADALAQVTGVPNRFANKPTGTRAIDIQDPATPSNLLETLGRCDRRETCATASESGSTSLRQSLLWIGSDTVDAKVGALAGYARQLLQLDPEPEEITESLYLRTLSRFPTGEEKARWSKIIADSVDRTEIVEDLFWALLNSREFLFNH